MATDQYEDDLELDSEIIDDEELDVEILDDDEAAVDDVADVDYDEDFEVADVADDADDEDGNADDDDTDDVDTAVETSLDAEAAVDDDDDDDEVVDLDDDDDDEDEETLEVLLGPDTEPTSPAPRNRPRVEDTGDAPPGEGEFTCRSCFLVKRRAQLADGEAMICLDCA